MKNLLVLFALFLCSVASAQSLKINPQQVSFSKIYPGDTVKAPFMVTNQSSVAFAGNFANVVAPFAIVGGNSISLGANESVIDTLVFAPIDYGVFQDSITIVNGSSVFLGYLNVFATAVNVDTAHIIFSSKALDFGTIAAGTTDTLSFTVTNPTPASQLQVTAVAGALGPSFTLLKAINQKNVAETPIAIQVIFRPSTAGVFDDSLHIHSNDKAHPETYIHLHGVAVASGVNDKVPHAVSVYPGVVSNELHVDLATAEPATIRVIDVLGNAISQIRTTATTARLDLSHLPNGSYFCQVEQSGDISTTRFVVSR